MTISSTRSRQSVGEPDRGDPAVLHAGLLDRTVVVEEGALADVERLAHHVVDVGPRVRAYDARGRALLARRACPSPRRSWRWRRAARRRPPSSRRCRRARGRSRRPAPRRRAPRPRAPCGRALPSSSGCSSAGWRVRVPNVCMTTTVGAAFDTASPSRHPGGARWGRDWTTRHRPPRGQRPPPGTHRARLPARVAQRRRLRRARRGLHPRRDPGLPPRPRPRARPPTSRTVRSSPTSGAPTEVDGELVRQLVRAGLLPRGAQGAPRPGAVAAGSVPAVRCTTTCCP